MFFEGHHSTEREYFHIESKKRDPGFPLHIHRSFECYAVRSGRAYATINGTEYTLNPGEAVLVFPYQHHEYRTESGTATWVCIFSSYLVGNYGKRNGSIPKFNKFEFDPEKEFLPDTLLLKKALCYRICGIFDTNAEYTEANSGEYDLLTLILRYISENYNTDCSLNDVSKEIGYDYSYISKFFKKATGQNYKSYVNSLRIGEACRLLRESDLPISVIAEQCGFTTVRSFNREFLKNTEKTPNEYRKST